MGTEAIGRLELQTDLQQALRRGELRLLYQPVVDLSTQSIVGAEALIRWEHPVLGLLSPGAFIPMAEETGLILPIGRWVLEEACKQAATWQRLLPSSTPFGVCVNLAVRQLEQPDLVDLVAAVLQETGLEPHRLELELTETAVINQAESTIAAIAALKAIGVRLAIDDFGTGYSSLSYLQRLAVDTVKIDQSFTKGLAPGSSTAAIVQAVVMLAHALEMAVTAEGIETAEQLSLVTALGCNYGQGYYFSHPCSVLELDALLPQPSLKTRAVRTHQDYPTSKHEVRQG
jgi:EAL domain-containing protein (putative c-di-GMP-specific phosphodiesterase class I)